MDKDRAKGSATNVGGKVKEGAGKLTGDEKLKVQIHGCVQGNEAEINQAVENALSNLMALAERGDIEFDSPEDMARVAEQMIRASIDRMGIEDVVGLSVTCVGGK